MNTFFPSETEKRITVVIITFCIGLSVGLLAAFTTNNESLISNATTLVAAFLGAWFAFRLQESREKEAIQSKKIQSGNIAIVKLLNINNFFSLIKQQHFDPNQNLENRHLVIPPIGGINELEKIDLDSLSFLFEVNETAIPQKIMFLNMQTKSLVQALEDRKSRHIIFQDHLAEAGISQSQELSDSQLKEIAGEHVLIGLKLVTDKIYELLESTMDESLEIANTLSKAVKRIPTKSKHPRIEPETCGSSDAFSTRPFAGR